MKEERPEPERQAHDTPSKPDLARPGGTGPATRAAGTGDTSFSLRADLRIGKSMLLEASAGTGKTYSLTSLVARYVAEQNLLVSELLMVTFTNAAAREMRDRTRDKLGRALAALEQRETADGLGSDRDWLEPIITCSEDDRIERIRRVRAAVSSIDGATITTIHSFAQQALREVGLRSADAAYADLAADDTTVARRTLRDRLVSLYELDDHDLPANVAGGSSPDFRPLRNTDTPDKLESKVLKVYGELASNLSATAAPISGDPPLAVLAAKFVTALQQDVARQRSATGALSFDDLITGLRDIVRADHPLSADIIASLRTRYRLVLIDEFQDTDDAQWEIFSTVFNVDEIAEQDALTPGRRPFLGLILVGDPKQAIYRFRGADISAYLRAAEMAGLERYQMTRNFRSDRDLVTATNRLFDGTINGQPGTGAFRFGDPRIPYVEVDAAKPVSRSLRIDSDPDRAKPLHLRWLPTDSKPAPTVDAIRPRIAEDLADHVTVLLNDGVLVESADESRSRKVLPGDICVLVRNHGDAEPIVDALRARGIPVIKSKIGTVGGSPALDQLRLLLSALADPADARRVKAYGLSWFENLSLTDLLVPAKIVEIAERCARWSSELVQRGVVEFFNSLRADARVMANLAATGEVERHLTDLEHLVELLHQRADSRRLPAGSLLTYLDAIAAEPETDETVRRIESDADAVQITTIHSSKGLEYPIVLIPYPKAPRTPEVIVYSHQDRRWVDASLGIEWSHDGLTKDDRKALAQLEITGDELRLLYVACTRARHQLVVWWANSKGMSTSPLARLLFGDHVDCEVATKALDGADGRSRFAEIASRVGDDLVHIEELDLRGDAPIELVRTETASTRRGTSASIPHNAQSRFGWRRWSFSTLAKSAPSSHVDRERGGYDEADERDVDAEALSVSAQRYEDRGLFRMQAGTEFGILVHEILEHVDFRAGDLAAEVQEKIEQIGNERLVGVDIDELSAGLHQVLLTPLEPLAPGTRLADISTSDRLAELSFHFLLGTDGEPPRPSALARIAAADESSPFAGYFDTLASQRHAANESHVAGLMTGSIDALLRLEMDSDDRYFVVDYKSNQLSSGGDRLAHDAYALPAMRSAMESHHYPLQALLYCVAVHRFLSTRVEGYDIDRHLGGAGYLFVRGMIGASTPMNGDVRNGVLAWRPSSATIVAADELLRGRRP